MDTQTNPLPDLETSVGSSLAISNEEDGEKELLDLYLTLPFKKQYALMLSWLKENKFDIAREALEREYETSGKNKPGIKEQLDDLLEEGDKGYCNKETKRLEGLHKTSILCVSFSPKDKLIASAAVDKSIILADYETGTIKASITGLHKSAVLSLDINPVDGNQMLTGSMDKTHALYDISNLDNIKVVQHFKQHEKYVIRVKWAPNGTLFATASYDHSLTIYRMNSEKSNFEIAKILRFTGQVEAIEFTRDSKQLIAAVRDDNYLHYIDLQTFKQNLINMNAIGDDVVSFTALDLQISDNDKYLIVTTDKNRIIMFCNGTTFQARNFYGIQNDEWSQPRSCFSKSLSYVYSCSQDKNVYIFDVSSSKVIDKLSGHSAQIRDMRHHPHLELIATCSYDKTIKLWGHG